MASRNPEGEEEVTDDMVAESKSTDPFENEVDRAPAPLKPAEASPPSPGEAAAAELDAEVQRIVECVVSG